MGKQLKTLKEKHFVDPESTSIDEYVSQLKVSLESVLQHQGSSPIYPKNVGIRPISKIIEQAELPNDLSLEPQDQLIKLHEHIQNTVKAGHAFMVKNIIPTVSTPALASYYASSIFMGNAVTGEDSAQTLLAELECVSAVSKLVGWNPHKSGGVFTFGGTATNLYAMKVGLSKVDPDHNEKGITKKVVCIESTPSHYCHATASAWLGIGTDNLVRVSSNPDQTTKINELEEAIVKSVEKGKKIACINALGGTTSNMGIDDIKQIYNIRNRVVKEYKLEYIPHIHVDAVLGWAYLVFSTYNFETNPHQFSSQVLTRIKKILRRIKTLKYADSFGVDFHKTGYVAYNSSMVVFRDKQDLKLLRRDSNQMTPLFHDDSAYNPGKYTLETSRSAANMLATWVALQTLGREGYQILLGHALEMSFVYRDAIQKNQKAGLFVANQEAYGPDVFVRCYPSDLDPAITYDAEMKDDELLERNTAYTKEFANWIEEQGYPTKTDGFAISRSSAAIYTKTGAPMVALRIYPLSPYITKKHAVELVQRLTHAKKVFDSRK